MARVRMGIHMLIALVMASITAMNCAAQAPTWYPTTKRPSTSPFQCSDDCPFGLLANARCDLGCDVGSCKFDMGQCPHPPCSVMPWIDCLNSTHDAYLPLRAEFFAETRNATTFFCNDTVAYFQSLANCTETFQCWNMFDRYMLEEGSAFDFRFCESQNDADLDILQGFCFGEQTCLTLLPGAPTSAPSVATPTPTTDLGPLRKTDVVLGIALGGIVGLGAIIALVGLFWVFCTSAGLVYQIKRKEKKLIKLQSNIRDLEEKNVNDVRTIWSNPGIRIVQLERMQEYKLKLDDELMALRTRKYGEQAAIEMSVRDEQNAAANESSPSAVIPVGTRIEPMANAGGIYDAAHTFEEVPMATVVPNDTHA